MKTINDNISTKKILWNFSIICSSFPIQGQVHNLPGSLLEIIDFLEPPLLSYSRERARDNGHNVKNSMISIMSKVSNIYRSPRLYRVRHAVIPDFPLPLGIPFSLCCSLAPRSRTLSPQSGFPLHNHIHFYFLAERIEPRSVIAFVPRIWVSGTRWNIVTSCFFVSVVITNDKSHIRVSCWSLMQISIYSLGDTIIK